MIKQLYNLQFPDYCRTFTIFDYKFSRVANYKERLKSLQHLISSIGEYNMKANNGEHAITAEVEFPKKEKKAVLARAKDNATG